MQVPECVVLPRLADVGKALKHMTDAVPSDSLFDEWLGLYIFDFVDFFV